MKLFLALFCAKFVKIIIKIFGKFFKFNGTHFPGKVALKICPDFLSKVGKPQTIIAVTGTNGKTTTCNLIIDLLEKTGHNVLNNKFGSNVQSGGITAFLDGVKLNNKCKYDIAVIEVDERSSAKIYQELKPTYILVTNLFRDSLKRNAHSEFIFNIINKVVPEESILICNSDDLISNRLGKNNKKVYFGIEKLETDTNESINIINDARICPICSSKLKYEFVRYHHIGRAYCNNCGYSSPKPDYKVKKIDYDKNSMIIEHENKESSFNLIANSIHNIYNEIAAITVLAEMGINMEELQLEMPKTEVTKTRYKKKEIQGYTLIEYLAKGQNPVACSIVFNYIKHEKGKKEIILLIEDYHDNKESSENIAWIYDCDFEFLNDESIEKILVCGHRAADINFRLLLAGIPQEKIIYEKEEKKIPDHLSLKKENTIYILYDMYEQPVLDNLNKFIEEKIVAKGDSENEN